MVYLCLNYINNNFGGLKVAKDAGFDKVICESDLVSTIKFIMDGVSDFHSYAPLIKHTLQQDDACVDCLVEFGATSHVPFMLLVDFPFFFSLYLATNVVGTLFFRQQSSFVYFFLMHKKT